MNTKYLIVIAGPTAVGKTALTVRLAQYFDTDIISADSRQFYKEMSIGTAKPTKEEQHGVIHHFVDSHHIQSEISAGEFEEQALLLLQDLFGDRDKVLLTGGSGLYINALTKGLPDIPNVPDSIRNQLNAEMDNGGIENLMKELEHTDPRYASEVDGHNPQRVIRALEVIRSTGKTFSSFRSGTIKDRPFEIIMIGLKRDREELYERINRRVDNMIDSGLVAEVTGLMKHRNKQALQTVGYKEVFEYLDSNQSLEETIELIKRNTRRYAKRQMTWFRKDENMVWFHPDDYESILTYIEGELST